MQKIKVNIVGRVDDFTGIGQLTKAFLKTLHPSYELTIINTREEWRSESHLPPDIKKASPFRDKEKEAPISIFTDVLWNGQGDNNWTKTPLTPIKFAYVVFDSSRMPIEWTQIVNDHYHGVLVPAAELVDVCRNSKIQKPVIYLPLGLNLRPYLIRPIVQPPGGKPYTYGFIGSLEPRKNIDLLLSIFEKVFGVHNLSVRLRVHLSYSAWNDYEMLKLVNRFNGTNVHITFGHVDVAKYRAILYDIDCFVSFSRGEGCSVIPREFMALGKPVILNDAFAHRTICEAPGVKRICADIPEPAFYPQIDGRYFGAQFSPYPEDAESGWRNFHERRKEFAGMAEARRSWASQFDYEQIKTLYSNIVNPPAIYLSDDDAVTEQGLYLSDENLIKTYCELGLVKSDAARSVKHTPKYKGEKVVVIANDGGFYSVFNRLVSYLTWTLTRNPGAIVLPDWRISKIKEHWKTDSFTSFCYGREEDGNIFLKLFEPLPYEGVDESVYNDERQLYNDAILKDDFNETHEPLLTYVNAYKLYKRSDFQKWRNWYHKYYSQYIIPKPHIRDYVEKFCEENFKGRFLIGAHVKHPSHAMEQPSGRMPTVELYGKKIGNAIGLAKKERKNPFIFLATDQESVVRYFIRRYGDKVIYRKDVKRTSEAQDRYYKGIDKKYKNREGFQIQHLTAADFNKWGVYMAEEVIIDAMLLAYCDVLIHVTSNVATAVAYMNPKTKMVYCE